MSNGAGSSGETNESGKRKIDQVVEDDVEDDSSDDDEEKLFLPQARLVLAQAKKPKPPRAIVKSEPKEDEKEDGEDSGEEEEDSGEEEEDEWETEGDVSEESENDTEGMASGEENESQNDATEENVDGVEEHKATMEELAAGREEKEDDEMMAGFAQAAQPQQRNKPKDIRTKFMVTDISFHPFEERIAMSNIEGEIFIYKYSVEENELLHTLTHHKKSCRTIMFNDNGSLLFSASKDKSVVITDTNTMAVTQSIPKAHTSPIYSMVCMDDNIWASGDDDGTVKVWDVRRNSNKPLFEIKEMDEFVSSMTTNSQAKLLLCTSGEGTLTAFNTRARKMDSQSEVYPSEMNCIGLMRQDTKVLTGLGNGMLYIFDYGSFGYHSDSFGDHPSGINCFLPITDNLAVTGCDDGKLRAINLFPHKFVGVVGHHRFPVERMDTSSCGHLIASSSHDGIVRFWDISYFEDPDVMSQPAAKKSVRNKKRSMRKEKLGYQLPSSRRRNKGDFFAGLAEQTDE